MSAGRRKAVVAMACTREISPAPTATSSKNPIGQPPSQPKHGHWHPALVCSSTTSAEIEKVELQNNKTWPGHVCASAQAFAASSHFQGEGRKQEGGSLQVIVLLLSDRKHFIFFSCPTGVRSPGLGRKADACSHGHRGRVWCAEAAEVRGRRKLCKEAG